MGWLKLFTDHLKGHPLEYIAVMLGVFGLGVAAQAIATEWLNRRIGIEVQEEIKPHLDQMASLTVDVSQIKQGLDNLILASIKRNIVEVKTLLCYSPGEPRLVRQYEELQEDYEGMMGRRYDAPGCDVLRRPG